MKEQKKFYTLKWWIECFGFKLRGGEYLNRHEVAMVAKDETGELIPTEEVHKWLDKPFKLGRGFDEKGRVAIILTNNSGDFQATADALLM